MHYQRSIYSLELPNFDFGKSVDTYTKLSLVYKELFVSGTDKTHGKLVPVFSQISRNRELFLETCSNEDGNELLQIHAIISNNNISDWPYLFAENEFIITGKLVDKKSKEPVYQINEDAYLICCCLNAIEAIDIRPIWPNDGGIKFLSSKSAGLVIEVKKHQFEIPKISDDIIRMSVATYNNLLRFTSSK